MSDQMENRPDQGLRQAALDLSACLQQTVESCGTAVSQAAEAVRRCFEAGGKLLICGNGGSAADSQHIAAEFVNRFLLDRPPLAAVALTTDTSILTACGNDFGFHQIFEKQVQALGRKGDVLLAISTSGSSKNVILALEAARRAGMVCIGMTGSSGGGMAQLCDILIKAASSHTPRIQETHIFLAHMICQMVESAIFKDGPGR